MATSSDTVDEPKTAVSHRDFFGRKQRFEARKVRRLIRHIDPWGVLKVSLVFFLSLWLMSLVSAIIVWTTARNVGLVEKIESLLLKVQIDVVIDGEFLLKQFGLLGLIGAFALTGAAVIACVIYNLINDIVGGIWITVIEEETARPASGSPE